MTTNVDDKASGASAWHFYIVSRSGDDDNNNYWQQQMTSVGRQGLMHEKTYSHRVARWRWRWRSQAHMLRVKHRCTNLPGNVKHRCTRAKPSNIDNLVHDCTKLSSAISHCAQAHIAFICSKPLCASARATASNIEPQSTFPASSIDAVMGPDNKLIDGRVQH